VIRDLVTGLDVLDRTDLDYVFHEIGFRIRSPARVDLEQVAGIELVGDFGANLPVANDELPLFDRDAGEETKPGLGSADTKVTRR
jgi:hypothetical protein